MNDYKFENTIGGQLFAKLKKATDDCIEYKGKSLDEWKNETRNNQAIEKAKQEARHAKMIYEKKREENLKSYCDQADKLCRYDSIGQFTDLAGGFDRSEMHIDKDARYRANMAFASVIDIDLEE